MTIKDKLDRTLSFVSESASKLLNTAQKPSIDILILYRGEPIGIAQQITFNFDARLWIGRFRFTKEKAAKVFKDNRLHKSSQLHPFDIVIRQEGLPDIILHDLMIEEAGYTYESNEWLIGENITLSHPKKVSLNGKR